MQISDLFYFDTDIQGLEQTEQDLVAIGFTFERDLDYIHKNRLSIQGEMDETEYYVWVMNHGLYQCSLKVQFDKLELPEKIKQAFKVWNQCHESKGE